MRSSISQQSSDSNSVAGRQRVELGCVVGAHGLRGEVRVRFFGDGPENLMRAPWVELVTEPGDLNARRYDVLRVGPGRAGEVRVRLDGVEDRDAAEALRGLQVFGDASNLEQLESGEHYWYQLIGCRVVDLEGTQIGVVREIWETGAHDLLVVRDEDGAQHLLPTADALLREVDVAEGRIVYDLVPGLVESAQD